MSNVSVSRKQEKQKKDSSKMMRGEHWKLTRGLRGPT